MKMKKNLATFALATFAGLTAALAADTANTATNSLAGSDSRESVQGGQSTGSSTRGNNIILVGNPTATTTRSHGSSEGGNDKPHDTKPKPRTPPTVTNGDNSNNIGT